MKDYNLLTRHKQKWTYLTAVKLIKANPRGVVTLADLEKELNTYSVMSFMQWDDARAFFQSTTEEGGRAYTLRPELRDLPTNEILTLIRNKIY